MDDTRTYRVPATNLARLEAELAELNKRAKRLRVPLVTFTITGWDEREVEHRRGFKYTKRWALVAVEGVAPKLPGGWRFVAKIEPTEAGNVVKSLPGVERVPEQYRTSEMTCDHCKTLRHRSEVFVVANEAGEHKQVGRNCLGDFTGHADPKRLAAMAEFDATLGELAGDAEGEGWGGSGGRGRHNEDTQSYLTTVAAFSRLYGFVPRSAKGVGGQATADRAWDYLTDPKVGKAEEAAGFKIEERDEETAKKALAWARELVPKSDYESNLRVISFLKAVDDRQIGILASLVNAYMREVEKQELIRRRQQEAVEKRLSHLGEIGQRQVFDGLTVTAVTHHDGYYGVTHRVKLADEAGNELVWWASNLPTWAEEGQSVRLKATVKKHDTFRDVPQTVLSRAALA